MLKSQIVRVELNSGQTIFAEVTPIPGERDVAFESMKFDSVVDSLTAIANQLDGAIRSVAPDKATVEFSLQLSAQSGKLTALLVQGEANATVRVALEWNRGSGDGNQ